jgi:hypothetical protein
MTTNITKHLEDYLGTIARGWGDKGDVQVVQFLDQPQKGVVTYSTLGLSLTPLPLNESKAVRQELLVSVDADFDPRQVSSFLVTFSEYVRGQKRALLRGDVIGPSEPLIPGVQARAVYASLPVFFAESFATYCRSIPPTVLVWLIPLPCEDAEYVKRHGWESFEERLETMPVDFWDLNRPPLR